MPMLPNDEVERFAEKTTIITWRKDMVIVKWLGITKKAFLDTHEDVLALGYVIL